MAEYALQRRIVGDPVFALWIRRVLEKLNRIIGKMNSKYWVCMHTFDVKIPKSLQEAKAFDTKRQYPLMGRHMQTNEEH